MADTRPTPISVWRAARLCFLTVIQPSHILKEDQRDEELRATMGPPPPPPHNAYDVQHAFWQSLVVVLSSLAVGFVTGKSLALIAGEPGQRVIATLQVIGASLLLWGTLFVRGWSIQTFSGVTLTERVNQWLYRALYFLGTAIVVCSLAWG